LLVPALAQRRAGKNRKNALSGSRTCGSGGVAAASVGDLDGERVSVEQRDGDGAQVGQRLPAGAH